MKVLRELLDLPEHLAEADKSKVVVEPLKPRNKQVNDVLRTRKGGRHFDKRKDYDRNKEKQKLRRDEV